MDCQEDEDDDFSSLVADDAGDYSLVLSTGEFSSARGFDIKDDGTRAILLEQTEEQLRAFEEVDEFGWTVIYSLSWTTGGQLLKAIAG